MVIVITHPDGTTYAKRYSSRERALNAMRTTELIARAYGCTVKRIG